MNITNSNFTQQNQNLNYQKKAPTFKANLILDKEAEIIARQELQQFYNDVLGHKSKEKFFGDGPFDFEKIYKNIQQMVKKHTKGIKGTIVITPDKAPNEFSRKLFNITYRNVKGEYLPTKSDQFPIGDLMLADPPFDDKYPLLCATSRLVGNVADRMTENGMGCGKNNPFYAVRKKLYFMKYPQ